MKRSRSLKVFCCLLAVLLLSGCAPKSPLLAHADDGLKEIEIAAVTLIKYTALNVENAEGDYVYNVPLIPDDPEDPRLKAAGTMDFVRTSYDESCTRFNTDPSPYFIFHCDRPEEEEDVIVRSRVFFYRKESKTEQMVLGLWNKIIYHCNNVIEIYGEPSETTVELNIMSYDANDSINPIDGMGYEINGTVGKYTVIALVEGEILTAGMAGNYSVRTVGWNIPTVIREYDKDGNLISTTEE